MFRVRDLLPGQYAVFRDLIDGERREIDFECGIEEDGRYRRTYLVSLLQWSRDGELRVNRGPLRTPCWTDKLAPCFIRGISDGRRDLEPGCAD